MISLARRILWGSLLGASLLMLAIVEAHAQTALPVPALTVGQGQSITFKWVAPTKRSDGSAITGALTYNLYNVNATGSTLLQGGITTTTNVRQNLNTGTPCYALTAVEAGVESAQTTPICVQVNSPPGVPAGFTVTVTVSVSGP